jgi:hypothetical protein
MSRHWNDALMHSRAKGSANKNHKYVAAVKGPVGTMYFYDMNAYNAYLKSHGKSTAGADKSEAKDSNKKSSNAKSKSNSKLSDKKASTKKLRRGKKLANKVMAGRYGTGSQRKKALGKNYEYVQNIVNQRMLGKKRAAAIAKKNNWRNV